METTTTTNEFRYGDEGNVICKHRDLSCCSACANAHSEVIAVEGLHFWVTDPYERKMLSEMGY